MYNVLFISPHLDDAVLSCGARIAALTAKGKRVLIVTVFTEAGALATEEKRERYSSRRKHDKEAAGCLGAEVIHLGYTDAPFRNAAYHNFSTLLFHHTLPVQERELVTSIAARLEVLIASCCPESVWFPLGVGGHIDHHIVYESSWLLPSNSVTGYYEELPYALLQGWNTVRWLHLNAVADKSIVWKQPALPALMDAALPFVRNYISTAEDVIGSQAKLLQEWEKIKRHDKAALQWLLRDAVLEVEKEGLPLPCLQQKCAAIACYATEYPALFGTVAAIRQELCRGQQVVDNYIEISWLNK